MPLKPFRAIPTNLRDWSRYFDDVVVTPDDLAVDTSKIANNAVTYAKIQNATNERLLGRGQGVAGTVQEIAASGGIEFNGTSIQRSALSGDVVAAAGDGATTIQPGVVTYAKLQDIATATLVGRSTAGTGVPEAVAYTTFIQSANVLNGSTTYDPPNLADGAGVTTTVTVTGAVLGDFALASFSLSLQGISVTAYVSLADTVSVRFQNESGGALDLASGTLLARVWKQ